MGYSYNPKSLCADEFINDEEILETLAFADAHKDDVQLCYDILEKCKPHLHPASEHGAMITHREASVLLACEDAGGNAAIKISSRLITATASCFSRRCTCRTIA